MGERRTQRHVCTQCYGKGSIESSGGSCKSCEGRGFNENPPGLESVCLSCNGEGTQKVNRTCKDCNGTGFTVRIYEFNDNVHKCLPCGGTGLVAEEIRYSDMYGSHVEQRQVKCPMCGGNGSNTSYGYKTIR